MSNRQAIKFIGIYVGIVSALNAASIGNVTKRSGLFWPQEPSWSIQLYMRTRNLTTVPKFWDYQDQRPECDGYISAFNTWGWGNRLLEVFTVFGLAIKFDKKNVLLQGGVRDKMSVVFPALKLVPSYEEVPCQMTNYLKFPFPENTILNKSLNLLTKRFAEDTTVALTYRKEILQIFDFRPSIKEIISQTILTIKETQNKKMGFEGKAFINLVGIHCRRTDYIDHLRNYQALGLTQHYYFKAMDMMRMKYGPNVAFVIATDDLLWAKEIFGYSIEDVYFSSDYYNESVGKRYVFDFALLTAVDHIVTSPGTFSFAAGFFVDGDVIIPDCRFQGLLFSPMVAFKARLSPNWYNLADPSFLSIPQLNSMIDT